MFEQIRGLIVNGNANPDYPNVFYPVGEEEIDSSERRLGYHLPEQLRIFYLEVGYGFFKSASPALPGGIYNYINRFLAPSQMADLLLGLDEEARPSEGFDEGEIPFFEVADRLYLVLRHSATSKHEVAWPFGDTVSSDLVAFTKALTANPRFYHQRS